MQMTRPERRRRVSDRRHAPPPEADELLIQNIETLNRWLRAGVVGIWTTAAILLALLTLRLIEHF